MELKKCYGFILDFLKKGNKTKIKLFLLIILSMGISAILDILVFKKIYGNLSFDRLIIVSMVLYFIGMHFILKLNKMYNFIYKKRYLLSFIILMFILVMGYSGSSITLLDNVIQPNNSKSEYKPILGKAREIRGDEWTTNTPLAFSQNKSENKLPYFTMNVRGTKTDMFTIINAPVLDVVSIGKPFNIGYIFGNKIGLSFQWYARLLALLLSSFELCMIISNQKKMASLVGALLITFSPAVQWWYSNFIADILIIGNIAIVLVDKFMNSKKSYVRYICIGMLAVMAVSYVFVFYPAWQIPFAYVYLALLIFVLIKNRNAYKLKKLDLMVIIIAIITVILVLLRYYTISKETLNLVLNTDYPGDRFELGGGAGKIVFSYLYGAYFPFYDTANPCEYSSMLSFYPIVTLLSFIFIFRNKDKKIHFKFLIPIWIVSLLLSVFCFTNVSSIFAKITLLYMCPSYRVAIPLGFSQILLLIYIMGNIKEQDKLLSRKTSLVASVILTSILIHIAIRTAPNNYLGPMKTYVSGIFFVLLYYLFFTINKLENRKISYALLILLSIISGACVNPIIKGVDVIYNKPLSKEVSKIVKNDRNALWIVDNTFIVPNYLAANGARTINTTNYYPNFELMNTIFGSEYASLEDIRKIYNRYAHVFINLTNNESQINLVQMDTYKIDLNIHKLQELNVKYICTVRDLNKLNNEDITFNQIYYEDGLYIYEVKY